MMRNSSLLLLVALSLAACRKTPGPPLRPGLGQPVRMIPLAGPCAAKSSELSGLAWHGDNLVLLPQYPDWRHGEAPAVFVLTRNQLTDFLEGRGSQPLSPRMVPFSAPGIRDKVPGYEGFESIAFSGDRVFLTIESHTPKGMMGFLVAGTTDAGLTEIRVDSGRLVPIAPQASIGNLTDEALLVLGDKVFTFYEANGEKVNAAPVAHQFTQGLEEQKALPFPHLEYRVTDATPADGEGRFWVMNFFYPGDGSRLKPAQDSLAKRWEPELAAAPDEPVERLVQMQVTDEGVKLVDRKPVWLRREAGEEARNWEGVAPFRNGVLVVTDTYPKTLLGYVAME